MKEKNIFLFELLSTILIISLGFILHFLFEWTNNNIFIGMFSSINESTWEHLKLLFFPMLLSIIVGSIYLKEYDNYVAIKTQGLFMGMFFIVIFFYTYTGVLGFNVPVLDIGSFIVACLISEYHTYKNINSGKCYNKYSYTYSLIITSFLFILFTFCPPHIGLFKDPVANTYGLEKIQLKD